ncbi:hypothetical protein IT072_11380 [Leifsonia sp. ZF2019]|uniref:hypothetical protein n=1 Tax=Leifsonia sp. ZF2019 TaxID=2781978 RepID=UPI001CBFBE00|nr:hypothetical protein [Leifsonia sp. ZF2019]UAJ77901.1 hypothetical protein IT072_11380 [Leifsonia sp. ZF2019]
MSPTPDARESRAEVTGLPWTLPGLSLRVAFALIAVPLALSAAPSGPWPVIGVALAAVTVVVPRWRTAWLLIAVLAFSALLEPAEGVSARLLALIVGVHVLHVLAGWMLAVPVRARLQPAVLLPGVRRLIAIQLPVQAVAVVILLLRPEQGVGAMAIVAGAAILAIAVLVAVFLLRPRRG